MRALAFLCLLFLATIACRAGWQDELSPPGPGVFPALRPVKLYYECGWSGFTAGNVEASFEEPEPGICVMDAKLGTTGVVRGLWRMDATHRARMNAATLKPIAMRQEEFYRAKTIKTALVFHDDSVTRLRESTADKNPARMKTYKYPNLYDLASALLYVRSQRLQAGDRYTVVVYPATAPYLATVTVVGRGPVKVKAGSYPGIELELRLQRITPEMTLEPHPKFKRATGWLSDDKDRVPLKLTAQIFVGSVWAELARTPGWE